MVSLSVSELAGWIRSDGGCDCGSPSDGPGSVASCLGEASKASDSETHWKAWGEPRDKTPRISRANHDEYRGFGEPAGQMVGWNESGEVKMRRRIVTDYRQVAKREGRSVLRGSDSEVDVGFCDPFHLERVVLAVPVHDRNDQRERNQAKRRIVTIWAAQMWQKEDRLYQSVPSGSGSVAVRRRETS
ncbi:uncharacterized protein EI90DRAFT_3017060 [Cantharellus anzutake]|uniref:uncharacterized protein n=1 Tax=Cantharellus anzutake TaxID=1750568 RepID=UPI001902D701|nr:uncharacterized protein EI90DRAFT_3017060 [Cantharellus anzutake]KAF8329738.1 hypothetical protein EI90DRAFT_3017060 [Cantharellus anzutake]